MSPRLTVTIALNGATTDSQPPLLTGLPLQVGRWDGGDCAGVLIFGPDSECSRLPEAREELRHDNVPWPDEVREYLCTADLCITDIAPSCRPILRRQGQPDAADWCVIEVCSPACIPSPASLTPQVFVVRRCDKVYNKCKLAVN
jgi:hypothetical protein